MGSAGRDRLCAFDRPFVDQSGVPDRNGNRGTDRRIASGGGVKQRVSRRPSLDGRFEMRARLPVMRIASLVGLFLLFSSGVLAQEAAPVTVPQARQYDFTSKINSRSYRLFVATPPNADDGKAYPVVYVLDGNWYFAASVMRAEEVAREGGSAAIVVGVGYPTDDYSVISSRRQLELTISASSPGRAPGQYGGGDGFLRVMEEEVKPLVAARYKIDPTRQTLYGKSLGGLMVLRQLFRHPEAYSTYIAASPSIWWNDNEVLGDEAAFAKRAKAGESKVRLLLTSAGDEQYRGDDAKLLAADGNRRMVDNVSDLADRLARLNAPKVAVARAMFPDETHVSVSLASLARALTFALKP